MNESRILRRIVLACSKGAVRLLRNQVGVYRLVDGRVLRSGLCNGSGDLIGWRTRVITQADVGEKIAQFVSLEVKTSKGTVTAEQLNWADRVTEAGGLAAIVRSEDDALQVLEGYKNGCADTTKQAARGKTDGARTMDSALPFSS